MEHFVHWSLSRPSVVRRRECDVTAATRIQSSWKRAAVNPVRLQNFDVLSLCGIWRVAVLRRDCGGKASCGVCATEQSRRKSAEVTGGNDIVPLNWNRTRDFRKCAVESGLFRSRAFLTAFSSQAFCSLAPDIADWIILSLPRVINFKFLLQPHHKI